MFAFINENKDNTVYTSIDLKSSFSKMFHIESCHFDKKPKFPHKDLKDIVDKKTLTEALEYNEEVKRLYDLNKLLVERAGGVYKAKQMLENRLVTAKEADLVISTIHGAKGLEWDEVIIYDDLFPADAEGNRFIEERLEDEVYNALLYVGITRARVQATVPDYLYSFVN